MLGFLPEGESRRLQADRRHHALSARKHEVQAEAAGGAEAEPDGTEVRGQEGRLRRPGGRVICLSCRDSAPGSRVSSMPRANGVPFSDSWGSIHSSNVGTTMQAGGNRAGEAGGRMVVPFPRALPT